MSIKEKHNVSCENVSAWNMVFGLLLVQVSLTGTKQVYLLLDQLINHLASYSWKCKSFFPAGIQTILYMLTFFFLSYST